MGGRRVRVGRWAAAAAARMFARGDGAAVGGTAARRQRWQGVARRRRRGDVRGVRRAVRICGDGLRDDVRRDGPGLRDAVALPTLVAAAEALGLKAAILAPPCDERGNLVACKQLARAAAGELAQRSADVELVCADGIVLAHRALLAAGSEYFAGAFRWVEEREGRSRIDLDRARCAVARRLLRSVYAGSAVDAEPLSARDAIELLVLARRYMLYALEAQAEEMVLETVRPEEVVHLLLRAQGERADEVVSGVFEWAVRNYTEVNGHLERWLHASTSNFRADAPDLADDDLASLQEELRSAWVKKRFDEAVGR